MSTVAEGYDTKSYNVGGGQSRLEAFCVSSCTDDGRLVVWSYGISTFVGCLKPNPFLYK